MSRRRPSRWHGLLPVYKLSGPTSHDIVDMARKALGVADSVLCDFSAL